MFTTQMVKLLGVVLDSDADKVTDELLRKGVMQFVNIAEVEREWSDRLSSVDPGLSLARIADMRKRIESFLSPVGLIPQTPEEIDLENRKPVDLEEESTKLDRIAEELQGYRERQRAVQQEIMKLEDIKRHVGTAALDFSEAVLSSRYSFISIRFGKVRDSSLSTLTAEMKDLPSVNLTTGRDGDAEQLLLIFMKRDTERVEKILEKTGWVDIETPRDTRSLKDDVAFNLEEKLDQLYREQEILGGEAKTFLRRKSEDLNEMWVKLRINELFYKIQSYFKRSSRTMIFSGWLPESKRASLTRGIRQAAEGRCYLEWFVPERGIKRDAGTTVPVQLKNPRFLSPFQMLVTNYGVPEYGTVDPTPFVMVAYLIMFGLMFADVGQGALLALAGLLGTIFFNKKKEAWQNLSKLIIWCGLSSVISGFLFGSYFGIDLLKPLWFDFHGIVSGHPHKQSAVNDIFDILAITVYFGIAVIGTGLLFNWINLSKKKLWAELFFDKTGIAGGWFFGGGIYVARYMITHNYREFPELSVMFWLVGLPMLLLYIKGPLHFMKQKKVNGKRFTILTLLNFAMEWVVEILEVFGGYLSNTLSFMRVAGLGIAHASLMIAFFKISRMVNPGGGPVYFNILSILILIFGNILVIGLEGLTAGIQALRLNYYEFFTKFFSGFGEMYSPVSLKSRD